MRERVDLVLGTWADVEVGDQVFTNDCLYQITGGPWIVTTESDSINFGFDVSSSEKGATQNTLYIADMSKRVPIIPAKDIITPDRMWR